VATDIAARGIDVTALGHVVNFDVPAAPEDYIHRVGRTARAELTGAAFTLVSSEEESNLRGIERAIDKRLPRVTVPDFDYAARAPVSSEPPRQPDFHRRSPRGAPVRPGTSHSRRGPSVGSDPRRRRH
jgi:ATP-dependent RNA helicase RhlE